MGKKTNKPTNKTTNKKVNKNPTKDRSKICLNMIVKNEAHVISETLESIKDYIDCWLICDTGSTDSTKEVITEFFKKHNKPGKIIDEPWANHFGYNRTVALKACKNLEYKPDYIWVIDADDLIVGQINIPKKLTHDSYGLTYGKGFTYMRTQIFSNKLDWEYVGVRHEYARCTNKKNPTSEWIKGDYHLDSRRLGDRSKDPKKYLNDALALVKYMSIEPEHATRYKFYAGQSYFDCGQHDDAIKWYEERIKDGGWFEEVYYSYYKIALAKVKRGDKWEEVKTAYLKAWKYLPARIEPLFEIAKHYRTALKDYENAYKYAKLASTIPYPSNHLLFLYKSVYDWEIHRELGLSLYHLGKYKESMEAYNKALKADINDQTRHMLNRDIKLSQDKLTPPKLKNQNKNIVFYVGYSLMTDDRMYGSELALLSLAKNLSQWYDIYIVGTSVNNSSDNKIRFMTCDQFRLVKLDVDILIISRYINYFLEFSLKANQVYIWVHDTVFHAAWNGSFLKDDGKHLIQNIWDKIDGVVALTNWHKNHLINSYNLPSDKFHIIGNGLNDQHFTHPVTTKILGRFIYTSDPSRGLDRLIKYFHDIHREFPYVQLYVYRDKNSFNDSNRYLIEEMNNCEYIHYGGKLNQEQLALEFLKSDIWLYPTDFSETYCMSGLEALRGGCYCIATDLAGLKDTIGDRGVLIADSRNKEAFMAAVRLAMIDEKHKHLTQQKAIEWAKKQTWVHRANEWLQLFGDESAKISDTSEDKDWICVRDFDSVGSDISYIPGQSYEDMKLIALENENCVGFNSYGYYKSEIKPESEWKELPGIEMYIYKPRFLNPPTTTDISDGSDVDVSKKHGSKKNGEYPFDKVYMINLERSVDRWQESLKECNRVSLPVERFSAVDGKTLSIDSLIIDRIILPSYSEKYVPGSLGCLVSNVRIWQQIVQHQYQWTLILEDDIIFVPEFVSLFPDYWKSVPSDADIVYLGSTSPTSGHFTEDEFRNHATVINQHILKITKYINGAYAYALSLKCAKTLLSHCLPTSKPVDFFSGSMFNIYAFRRSKTVPESFYLNDPEKTIDIKLSFQGLVSVRNETSTIRTNQIQLDGDWLCIPYLDSPGHDISYHNNRTITELKALALQNEKSLAFNSRGYVKNQLLPIDQWVNRSDMNLLFYLHLERYKEILTQEGKSFDEELNHIYNVVNKYKKIINSINPNNPAGVLLKDMTIGDQSIINAPQLNILSYQEITNSWTGGWGFKNGSLAKYKDGWILVGDLSNVITDNTGSHLLDISGVTKPEVTKLNKPTFKQMLIITDANYNVIQFQNLHHMVGKYEDPRIFKIGSDYWVIMSYVQNNQNGIVSMVTGMIDSHTLTVQKLYSFVGDYPSEKWQKNWSPYSETDQFKIVYSVHPWISYDCTIQESQIDMINSAQKLETSLKDFVMGGSPYVKWKDGWLTIAHEQTWSSNRRCRYYAHRFIYQTSTNIMATDLFYIKTKTMELATGIHLLDDNTVIISCGVEDRLTAIVTIDLQTIKFL